MKDKSEKTIIDKFTLKERIIQSLTKQGFRIQKDKIFPPDDLSKNKIRELHRTAIEHRISQAKEHLLKKENECLKYIASGKDISPKKISPCLVEVRPRSKEELLFRYASLHWSIPVSSGYGRRLRFIIIDEYNGKLIGLIGLGDPVFSLKPRDQWVGWTLHERKEHLRAVMDAFVLGAVPPYSFLLCGKLVAMLTSSKTIRLAFKKKYGKTCSVIKQKVHDGRLALITTTSALGRSSIYNRLRYEQRIMYKSVGFTKGSGEFHFSNGLYKDIVGFTEKHCIPTAKQEQWGTGFRNRREVIRKCLQELGLSSDWLFHGIEREVFVLPLAQNTREFLRGKHNRLIWYNLSEKEIFDYFVDRWMFPRLAWDERYKLWSNEEWMLWLKKENIYG